MHTRIAACLLLITAVSQTVSLGQARLSYGVPASVAMSAEKLAEGVQLFKTSVARDEIRNVVLLVTRRRTIVLHEAIGWRDKARQLPIQRDALFRMASNTKAIVAAGVLLLVQDGCIELDDPIGRHLPAFDNDKCRGITIRHLLSHTSGLRIKTLFLEPLMKPSSKFPDAPNLQLEVDRFAEVGPEHKPGTTFSYNNPGYNILGALIEARTGQPLESFLTRRIYVPLGMCETTNHPVPERVNRMSFVYERKNDRWKVRYPDLLQMRVPFVRASGGMVSTATDFAQFCQMFLDRGRHGCGCLLTPTLVAEATTAQTESVYSDSERMKRKSFYGLGWFVSTDGHYYHGGSEGTFAWIDPKRDLFGLIFTQSPGGKIPRDQFRRLVNASCEN